jgi:prevent-host-death family protein
MRSIDIAEATGPLHEYARNARKEVVIVTRDGKPVAAVVGVDQFDYESVSVGTNPTFIDIIARSRARLDKEGGIPSEALRLQLGLPSPRRRRQRPKRP